MKKKDIITIIIIAILLAGLVFGAVFLASRHRRSTGEKKILGIVGEAIKDNSAYMKLAPKSSSPSSLVRFDLETESLEYLCRDENCDGRCPLHRVFSVSRIDQNRVYFQFKSPTGYAYYDLGTGETHVIKEYEYEYEYVYYGHFLYNGNIYHMRKRSDNEAPKVYRLSRNGKEKAILKLEEHEFLIMVADGMIITEKTVSDSYPFGSNSYTIIYSYDIDTLKRRELWQSGRDGTNTISHCKYYNGKLYFLCGFISFRFEPKCNLYCLDTSSGEAVKVSDSEALTFGLSEENIYYITKQRHEFANTDGSLSFKNEFTLWSAELSGIGSHEVFKTYAPNDITTFQSIYFCNGKIFGECASQNYMVELLEYKKQYLYVIDVQGSEIRIIDIPR